MKRKFKRILAILCIMFMVAPSVIDLIPVSEVKASDAVQGVKPIVLEGFNHVTLSDFGIANKAYKKGDTVKGTLSGETSLDKTVVSMKVNFGTAQSSSAGATSLGTTGIYIAGSAEGGGFLLFVSKDGKTLHMQEALESTKYTVTGEYRKRISYTAADAEIETFLNNEILLQMSFEYTDAGTGHPGGNTDIDQTALCNMQMGMYINGKLYKNQKTELTNCNKSRLGTHLSLRLDETNSAITLASVNAEGVKPVVLEGFNHVTLSDFGIANKAYKKGDTAKGTLVGETSLDKTMVSMKVNFGTAQNSSAGATSLGTTGIYIAGSAEGGGFLLFVSKDGKTLHMQEALESTKYTVTGEYRKRISYTAADAGVETFLNNEILLQMSFEYTDAGTGHPGGNTDIDQTALCNMQMGMYINGKLYKNQKTELTNCNKSRLGTHMSLRLDETDSAITLTSVNAEGVKPVVMEGFNHVTLSDFGIANKAYKKGDTAKGTLAGETSLDKTMVSMKVNFGTAQNSSAGATSLGTTGIYIAGSGEGGGFLLFVSKDGKTLHMQEALESTKYTVTGEYRKRISYTAADAGVETFLNSEILLQMSFEYTDAGTGHPGGNTDIDQTALCNMQMGMYINGKLYKNQKTELTNCNKSRLGTHMSLRLNETDSAITLTSVNAGPKVVKPVYLEGYRHLTLSDYLASDGSVMTDTTFTKANQGTYSLSNGSIMSFDKTVLSMKLEFATAGVGNRLYVGAKKDTSVGFGIYVSNDGQKLYLRDFGGSKISMTTNATDGSWKLEYNASDAGLDTFLNKEFILQMSFDYDNANSEVKLGMYFNGKLYKGIHSQISNCNMERFGTNLCAELYNDTDSLKISVVTVDSGKQESKEELDPNLETITFGHYGIRDGEYKINRDGNPYTLSAEGYYYGTTYDGFVFSGDVTFGTATTSAICFGGLDSTWRGLKFTNDSAGNIILSNLTGYKEGGFNGVTFTSVKAGRTLVGEKINLKLSFQYVELDGDGVKNDVKLGVWFNDILYDNAYMYLNGMAEHLGFYMGIYCDSEEARLTVASVGDVVAGKQPDAELTRISFADYGVENGVYRINNIDANPFDFSVEGLYKGSIDGILFDGNLLYSTEGGATITIGGKDDAWHGFRLTNNKNGRLVLSNVTGGDKNVFRSMIFSEQIAGTQLIGKEFNFKMSIQFEDFDGDGVRDDVKLGLWFNDALYANQYLYLDGFAEYLGNHMGVFCETENSSVTIKSYEGAKLVYERPNEDFQKITFSDFGISDGAYTYGNSTQLTMLGRLDGIESLDRTIICGNIFASRGEGISLMIGGKDNPWYGVRFTMRANGKWKIGWVGENSYSFMEFRSGQAKAILTDEWLNLMVSTEVIDADQDGLKDDLRFGFWFNGRLLQEEYFTILDCADELGKYLAAYCETEGAVLKVASVSELVKPFNYARYGLNSDWSQTLLNTGLKGGKIVGGSRDAAPFTGELLASLSYIAGITLVIAISAGVCIWGRKKRKK